MITIIKIIIPIEQNRKHKEMSKNCQWLINSNMFNISINQKMQTLIITDHILALQLAEFKDFLISVISKGLKKKRDFCWV